MQQKPLEQRNRIGDLNVRVKSRHIRVFLSSTFTDMEAERRQLIKTTFPRLRKVARERGAELTEVDLRWGITEESSKTGQAVRLCLNEILECAKASDALPFFVGLLGERYGWVPTLEELRRDPRLASDFPTVLDHVAKRLSVTEMEIIHGVLEEQYNAEGRSLRDQAFFFVRDKAFTDSLRREFPKVAFYDAHDPKLTLEQKDHAEQQLERLKAAVDTAMAGHHPPVPYGSVGVLDHAVEQAFLSFLDNTIPAGKPETFDVDPGKREVEALGRRQTEHVAFAQTRMDIHVGGEACVKRLDELSEKGKAVLLTGPVGSGKTALLAKWIAHRQAHRDPAIKAVPILYHFCGGAPESDTLNDLLRRLIAELQLHAGMPIKVPTEPVELPSAFQTALHSVPRTKPLILAIDALDQLDTVGDFRFWPHGIPDHVRTVVSVKSPVGGKESLLVGALKDRGLEIVEVKPLSPNERVEVVRLLLKRYGKELSDDHLKLVADLGAEAKDREVPSPLVLRLLVEELRQFGSFEGLTEQIRFYTDAQSPEAFFEKALVRMESDFPSISEVLALIGASHIGLSESEILDLMNPGDPDHKRFTKLEWATLHETLRPHLKTQEGCLTWFHDLARQAVENRYLKPDQTPVLRRRLAGYFLDPLRKLEPHSLGEWPWLLRQLEDKPALEAAFMDGEAQAALIRRNQDDTHSHWLWLAEGKGGNTWIASKLVKVSKQLDSICLWPIAMHLGERVGQDGEAVDLWKKILAERIVVPGPNHTSTLMSKNNLAKSLYVFGQFSEALALHQEVLEDQKRILGEDHPDTIVSKVNLANCLSALDRDIEARKLREEALAQRIGALGDDHPSCLTLKLNLTIGTSNPSETLELRNNLLDKFVRVFGSTHSNTLQVRVHIADAHSQLNQHEKALKHYSLALSELTCTLGLAHSITLECKYGLARTLSNLGRHTEALDHLHEVLVGRARILKPDHPNTRATKIALGRCLSALNRCDEALTINQELLKEFKRNLGPDHPETLLQKVNLATCLYNIGHHENALELWKEIVTDHIRVFGDNNERTLLAKKSLASLFISLDHHKEATPLWRECIEKRSNNAKKDKSDILETLACKSNLANSLAITGHHFEAFDIFQKVLAGRTEISGPEDPDTLSAKHNLAACLSDRGRCAEALKLQEEILSIQTRLIGPDCLENLDVKNNMAVSLGRLGRWTEAKAMLEDVISDCVRSQQMEHRDTIRISRILEIARQNENTMPTGVALDDEDKKVKTGKSSNAKYYALAPDCKNELNDMLKKGKVSQTLALLEKEPNQTTAVQNARAVCLMRLGRSAEALDLLKAIAWHKDNLGFLSDIPLAYKINYATALVLCGEVYQCEMMVLDGMNQDSHPAVSSLRLAISEWKKSFSAKEKISWFFSSKVKKAINLAAPLGIVE